VFEYRHSNGEEWGHLLGHVGNGIGAGHPCSFPQTTKPENTQKKKFFLLQNDPSQLKRVKGEGDFPIIPGIVEMAPSSLRHARHFQSGIYLRFVRLPIPPPSVMPYGSHRASIFALQNLPHKNPQRTVN